MHPPEDRTDGAPAPAGLRLFIAVQPPPDVRDALRTARAGLERALRTAEASLPTGAAQGPPLRLRWVRPEAIHLTLRFLGQTPAAQLPAIERALATAAAATPAHTLRLQALGSFGGRRPRVVWANLGGAVAELEACARALNAALAGAGLPAEARELRPHLTLARVPDRAGRARRAALLAAIDDAGTLPPLPIPVRELHLIQSVLSPGGARYATLARATLAAG